VGLLDGGPRDQGPKREESGADGSGGSAKALEGPGTFLWGFWAEARAVGKGMQ
jgi:hypothetical protein